MNIDWALLRRQRATLVEIAETLDDTDQRDAVEGILNLLYTMETTNPDNTNKE